MTSVDILAFDKRYDRGFFSCGKPDLDEWLKRYAGQSERRDTTRTFLAVDQAEEVLGYYAMRTIELDLDDAAAAFGVGRRSYPVGAVLLARLAVDVRCQGRGVGAQLLVDALQRLTDASHSIGFECVVVDAIDDEASTFYRRYEFQPFENQPRRLFMPTKRLRASFAQADS